MGLSIKKFKKLLKHKKVMNFERVWKKRDIPKRVPTVGLIFLLILGLVFSLFSFPFPIKESKAANQVDFPNIYIDGTTGGVGSEADPLSAFSDINWTTGGDNSVYDAVAAGEDVTINLKKGVTWREQMTVGASGSAAHPITIQAYGEGADPIISGADLVTGWTEAGIIDVRPAANDDDGYIKETSQTWHTGGDYLITGLSTEQRSFHWRFVLDVPNGATISTAHVTTKSGGDIQDGAIFDLSADDSDDSVTIDTIEKYNTAFGNKTAATVNWDLPATVAETTYDTPEIKTIVQEIVDRGSWASGNHIQLLGKSTVASKAFYPYSFAYAVEADRQELHVEYDIPNIWKTTLTTEPEAVWFDGVFGDIKTDPDDLVNEYDWYWDSNILYCYSTADPDGAYTNIEAGARNNGMVSFGKSYLTFDGLNIQKAQMFGYQMRDASTIIIQNCTFDWNVRCGILINGESGANTDITIDSNVISNTMGNFTAMDYGGIATSFDHDVTHTGIISNNTIHMSDYGIPIHCDAIHLDAGQWTVENNTLYEVSHGLYVDQYNTAGTIIRYNYIYDTADDFIYLAPDAAASKDVYYNVCGNSNDDGIQIKSDANIYNNVIYNASDCGIVVDNYSITVNIKNNVLFENGVGDGDTGDGQYEIRVAGSNSTVTSDYNCVYHSGGGTFMNWEGTDYNWADWLTNSSQDANSLNTDPLMTDPANDDFTLNPHSPCVNAGTDVGLTEDYAGNSVPRCSIPDIGAYENQTKSCPVIAGGIPSGYSNPPIPGPNGFKCIINNNDESTSNREVTLTLEAGENVKYAAVSEKQDFSDAGFELFEPSKTFTLSLGNGLKRVYAQFLTAYSRFSEIVYDEIILDASEEEEPIEEEKEESIEEEKEEPVEEEEEPETCLPDGSLIKLSTNPKVYVIINCKRKWIRTAGQFNQEGYKWTDIKEVNSPVLNAYADYLEAEASLVRAIGHQRVYRIVNRKRLWIPTITAFNAQGLKWEDIEDIGETIVNQYPRLKLTRATNDPKIYYLTENGLKRWIPTIEIFNSYNNKWEDVIELSLTELNAYPDSILIRLEGGTKVYKLENGKKRWIRTAQALNRLKYDWAKIVPVNSIELNYYIEGKVIE